MNTSAEIKIKPIQKDDFPAVKKIYQAGINTGIATFETLAPTWETWNKKFRTDSRLLAENNNSIIGWVALSPVSARQVYSGVCEVSLYVHPEHSGRGVGRALLRSIIAQSEKNKIWTLQAGIFPENKASIALHTSEGFREVGYREKIGKRDGVWHDNIFLERRSRLVI
ncbi:MAG: N-acetyltransferase family protein [Salegentibacter sp.]|uniref:Phosphinothricin acetyltransferase n=1 Tax=Salegentibacter flavus TaxID=287099 RepID=A0A1I5BS56_9FLAO|nr:MULTISPECIES: GNAT family N-acetyltransferase [Salegentibacter]MDR9457676.1 N-acetyltransferase family protein [Salegentibacter sp.]SFN77463.1 phosphinothricin acetyltransferase [Salegentibacter flavus]